MSMFRAMSCLGDEESGVNNDAIFLTKLLITHSSGRLLYLRWRVPKHWNEKCLDVRELSTDIFVTKLFPIAIFGGLTLCLL